MAKTKKVAVEHPCQHCEKEIPNWRSNKLFCDNECKYKFNNKLQQQANLEMGRVNKILKKNFDILKTAIKAERYVKIKKIDLEKKGFNFEFMTHVKGAYKNCYLLSWRDIENGHVIVSRTPDSTFNDA